MANPHLPVWRAGERPDAFYFAAEDRVTAARLSHKALPFLLQPEDFTRVPGVYATGRPRRVKL